MNDFNLEEIKNSINDLDISNEAKLEKIKAQIQSRLIHLADFLNKTDYKIIKCYEASMRQITLPYNLEELCIQRDAWRAEINQLEEELAELE